MSSKPYETNAFGKPTPSKRAARVCGTLDRAANSRPDNGGYLGDGCKSQHRSDYPFIAGPQFIEAMLRFASSATAPTASSNAE
jgi:hypothetical protein